MKRASVTAVAATAACGLALTQAACSTSPESSGSVPTSAGAAPAATGASPAGNDKTDGGRGDGADDDTSGNGIDAIMSGNRQINMIIDQGEENTGPVKVDGEGRLFWDTEGANGLSLFVLDPLQNGKHQIKVVQPDVPEPACLGLKNDPETTSKSFIVATACDVSRAGQIWTIEPSSKADGA
ncbi:hypothetical protein ACWKSP_38060 [Micromonosporaceae bacterium Da 78-11]